ncbi:hypothetical protein CFP56_012475 [Quercus suber]|uniref:Uncharacterized protein n=1 Tax=Quercus suber TaxID=58331 RepID=A0AAW0KVL3_QUESU
MAASVRIIVGRWWMLMTSCGICLELELDLSLSLSLSPSNFNFISKFQLVHPEIKPYRKWGCPTYEELYTIFIKPKVTGESGRNCHAHSRENVNDLMPLFYMDTTSASQHSFCVSGPNKK